MPTRQDAATPSPDWPPEAPARIDPPDAVSPLRPRWRVRGAAAGGALGLHLLLYRFAFGAALAREESLTSRGMIGWNQEHPVAVLLASAVRDLPLVLAFGAIVTGVAWLFRGAPRAVRLGGEALLVAVLLVLGLASAANRRMGLELGCGLDLPALGETGMALRGADLHDFVEWGDLLLAPSAALFYALLRPLCRRASSAMLSGSRRLSVAALGLFAAVLPGPSRTAMWGFVLDHPIVVVGRQIVALQRRDLEGLAPLAAATGGRPGFVDPALVREARAVPPRAAADRGDSVLFVVLESVAARELAAAEKAGPTPMPTLRRLESQGWSLARHRASSTSSDAAAFALFTGLYSPSHPVPRVSSPRLRLPAMWSRLTGRDAFLLSAARLDGYFPLGLARHDGLGEILDYFALEPAARRPHPDAALNELDAIDAMVERIARTRGRRFFGTYWIDAAHLPYFDHDPADRWVAEPVDDRDRYRNTLRIADRALSRTLEALVAAGHGEDTLVVVVGDHGEAFGEHGDFAHRAAWEEVLHVPALLWRPGLLAPRVDTRPTSHADLLPTLLEAVGLPFDPLEFQGESLFAPELRRRYVFATGSQGVVVAWAGERKMAWSWIDGTCASYDLARDPGELEPAPCAPDDEQYRALRRFYMAQRGLFARLAAGPDGT